MQQEMLAGYESGVMGDSGRYQDDGKLLVTFYRGVVHNPHKSSEAGRPIFDEHDFVRIIVPGDRSNIRDTKATAEHKMRFAKQWERYKAGQEQAQSGTPLEVWPQITVSMVATLKASGITTVEQLAGLSDTNAAQFMGSHELRRRAQTFLDAAKGEAVNTKLEAELEKRDQEISVLKQQMSELMAASKANTKSSVAHNEKA